MYFSSSQNNLHQLHISLNTLFCHTTHTHTLVTTSDFPLNNTGLTTLLENQSHVQCDKALQTIRDSKWYASWLHPKQSPCKENTQLGYPMDVQPQTRSVMMCALTQYNAAEITPCGNLLREALNSVTSMSPQQAGLRSACPDLSKKLCFCFVTHSLLCSPSVSQQGHFVLTLSDCYPA